MNTQMTKTEQEAKIKLFNELKDKDYNALQYLCIQKGLEHNGEKMDLIRRIVNNSHVLQNLTAPQAFAIKSATDDEAKEFARAANARILPQDGAGKVVRERMKTRIFKFLDKQGSIYEVECPYVQMKDETVVKMVEKGWLSPLETQHELLATLKTKPQMFSCSLIRKRTGTDGRFYLMVHVEPKAVNG